MAGQLLMHVSFFYIVCICFFKLLEFPRLTPQADCKLRDCSITLAGFNYPGPTNSILAGKEVVQGAHVTVFKAIQCGSTDTDTLIIIYILLIMIPPRVRVNYVIARLGAYLDDVQG